MPVVSEVDVVSMKDRMTSEEMRRVVGVNLSHLSLEVVDRDGVDM